MEPGKLKREQGPKLRKTVEHTQRKPSMHPNDLQDRETEPQPSQGEHHRKYNTQAKRQQEEAEARKSERQIRTVHNAILHLSAYRAVDHTCYRGNI